VKALGKINVSTGVVTQLPTLLDFDNYIMNSGGAIDPSNLVYYFQTMDSVGIKLVGLSLTDGSVVSQVVVSSVGNYFDMYRIQSECYQAEPTRANPATASIHEQNVAIKLYPNPVQEELHIVASSSIDALEIQQLNGTVIYAHIPNETSARISVAGLSPGMYLVNMKTKAGNESYRFIKN
jgi:hypothetical protein